MGIRKFLLKNEKGQQFRLDSLKDGCFFTSPKNFGYSYKIDFIQLGNTFIENEKVLEQKNPSGTLYFKSYDKVEEFIDYVESSERLKLLYTIPLENKEKIYYKDIITVNFEKTEKNGKWLECPIEFAGKSLWYEEVVSIYNMSAKTDELRWNFKWDSKFTSYDIRRLEYINKGHVEAPIVVEINGPVKNPKIELYVEGELYQTVALNIEINEYEKLLYSTKEDDFYISKQNTDGTIEDLFDLDYINPENDNIIRLPKNKSCELRLKADNEILNAIVKIYSFKKAV